MTNAELHKLIEDKFQHASTESNQTYRELMQVSARQESMTEDIKQIRLTDEEQTSLLKEQGSRLSSLEIRHDLEDKGQTIKEHNSLMQHIIENPKIVFYIIIILLGLGGSGWAINLLRAI
jgi:hypothetical protein